MSNMNTDVDVNTKKRIMTPEEADLKLKIQKALEAERKGREELEERFS